MFNGIIYNTGKITKIFRRKNGINLFLKSNIKLSKRNLGISVSCDGVCLTLISVQNKILEFFLSEETNKCVLSDIFVLLPVLLAHLYCVFKQYNAAVF